MIHSQHGIPYVVSEFLWGHILRNFFYINSSSVTSEWLLFFCHFPIPIRQDRQISFVTISENNVFYSSTEGVCLYAHYFCLLVCFGFGSRVVSFLFSLLLFVSWSLTKSFFQEQEISFFKTNTLASLVSVTVVVSLTHYICIIHF